MDSTPSLNLSKKNIKREPSIPVRQTKTSKIRNELGNPLDLLRNKIQKFKNDIASSRSDLTSSKESIKSDVFKKPTNMIDRKSSVSKSFHVISRTDSGLNSIRNKATQSNPLPFKPKAASISKSDKALPSKAKPAMNISTKINLSESIKKNVLNTNITRKNNVKSNLNKTVATVNSISKNRVQSKVVKSTSNININKLNISKIETKSTLVKLPEITLKSSLKSKTNTLKIEKKNVTIKSPLRKSISAMHLKRVSIRDPKIAIHKSFSTGNIHEQTIYENDSLEIPIFDTPMAKRRSIFNATPMSAIRTNMLSPWSGCWSPTAQDLKRRLSIWMEKSGKPYNSFHHLRCFGMHYLPSQEENKENIKVNMTEKNSSYNDLRIPIIESQEKVDISVAYEALHDLHKLILEGYPVDQCEAWLDVIRTRFEELEDKPQYWECMAAVDEARGNINKESNKHIENNEDSLGNLLEKFNVLNLTPSKNYAQTNKKLGKDLKHSNIFKSSKINFEVKESSKHEGKKFLVTPVKRSTRQSTVGNLTPGIIICSSLNDLDSSVRTQMHFQTNKALKK